MVSDVQAIKKQAPYYYDHRDGQAPFLVSGSLIRSGKGKMVVCAVGKYSTYETIHKLLIREDDESCLQQKLLRLADKIHPIGFYATITLYLYLVGYYFFYCFSQGNFAETIFSISSLYKIIKLIVLCVCMIMVLVPEGLPLIASVAYNNSLKGMSKQNVLGKSRQGCESMGFVDNIVTDMTGTLTQNLNTVTKILVETNVHSTMSK
jgi:magnesium-transporting ATPase (P-type)